MDDGLHAGDAGFLQDCDKTQQKFKSRARELENFTFAGIQVATTPEGIRLHEEKYARTIKPLSVECTFREFRSCRQKLQWLVHTRPEIACAVNKATQVTEEAFARRHVENINKSITHVHKNPSRGLLQRRLDPATLHFRVYSDASFADNEDLSTQLGFLVLLCDGMDRSNILHYSSHKSRRVVRSVMGEETYSMADGTAFTLTIRYDLQKMLYTNLTVRLYTDSHCIFDVITKNTTTTEKRLMIDVQAMREA